MADIINTAIPDINTSWENYSGDRVEEFIKSKLNTALSQANNLDTTKGSYLALLEEVDSTSSIASVGIFASKESYTKWAADKDGNTDLILSSVEIPLGSGGSSAEASYIVKLSNMGSSTITATSKDDLKAKIRFTSQQYDPSDGTLSDTNETAVLTIQVRTQGASDWRTVVTDMEILSQSKDDATTYTEIDLSSYCSTGTQSVRMTAEGTVTGKKASVIVTAILTNISITFQTSWHKPFEYKVKAPTITIPVLVTGTISKILHFQVTSLDSSYSRTYTYNLGTTTYTETPFSATIDHPVAHGVYTIEAWITSSDGTVKTAPVTESIMCTLAGNTTPLLVINNVGKFENWSNVSAFDYAIYNPNTDSTDITFTLTNSDNEEVVYSETVQNVQNNSSNSLTFDLGAETDTQTNFPASMSFTSGETVLRTPLAVVVDNSGNFAPTSDADFYLNPKTRNNNESTPNTIINAVDGQQVSATFEGFSFASDGWVTDSNTNTRCLRVLSGQKVSANYDAYSDNTASEGLTIELDFATRNVVDEEKALLYMGTPLTTQSGCYIGFWLKAQESCFMTVDNTTEESQNWIYSKETRTHVAINIVPNLYNQGTNYVRVFINGIISREFVYADTDSFWQSVSGTKTTGGIVIAPQDADIDIYGLRIYKKSLSATDIRQNYLSSLPTIEKKKAFKEANDIMGENGLISYDKAKEVYNTILYEGAVPSYKNKGTTVGNVKIIKIGDPAHSGTLYNMTRKGQGTTSKNYWIWNIQSDFKGDAETCYWEDGNGVNHGQCYQNADGLPMAKKLVDKRNWASSMQSHKMGATKLYNDLYKEIVGKNEITSIEGFENCRVCVYEDPFLVFQKESDATEEVFIGLGTFGSGKGDKPTFGYDKTKSPNMLMIEGADNNPRLTKHQVPWIEDDVVYDADEEAFYLNGLKSWDYGMGNLDSLSRFIEAFNFVYLHSSRLKVHKGTYTNLKADASTLDISYCYWVTQAGTDSARFDLYRYDDLSGTWVSAGASKNTDGSYTTINLKEQLKSYLGSDFTQHETNLDWESMNDDFIKARRTSFAEKVENYFAKDDILFCMCMMKLMAGCDNRAKNTYLWVFDTNSPIRAMQDDLDSIFPVDNQGKLTKPYYVEEHDYDSVLKKNYWNAEDNVLYNLMEECFTTDIRTMMNDILSSMASLGGGTVDGCWEKYFLSTCQYFPAVAYNEFARIGYETAYQKKLTNEYDNDTDPITQSLGSQEEGERQWLKDRTVYMSSFAKYGEFNSNQITGGSIIYRSTEQMLVKFDLTMARWLYPVVSIGTSNILSGVRVKAGERISASGITDSNTQNIICGVNYMSDIGTWYDKPANGSFAFSGNRITELIAGTDSTSDIHFKVTSLVLSSMKALRKLDIHNLSTLTGALDISKNTRLEELDARGTSITGVSLPKQEFLTTLKLPSTVLTLSLDSQTGLSEVSMESWDNLQSIYINQRTCPKIDAYALVKKLQTSTQLAQITVLGIDWSDMTTEMLTWLLTKQIKLTGKITMANGEKIDVSLKRKLINAFGNVDDKNNSLYLSYNQVAITSVTLGGKAFFSKTGTYSLSLVTQPTLGNNLTNVSWEISSNSFATIDSETGVITVNKVGSKANDDSAVVTATVTLASGETLTATNTIRFYQYELQLGDYLFNDGSVYNDTISGLSPVGVCFYINPDNRNQGLFVALSNMNVNYDAWGLFNSSDSNGISGITLADNPSYQVYDIGSIDNITSITSITDDNVRGGTNQDADGFRIWDNSYPNTPTTMGDIGFVGITSTIYNTEGLGSYLSEVGLKVGDKIAVGLLKTLRIMHHRDIILSDSNVGKSIPKTNAELTTAIKTIIADHSSSSKYQQYYYPAASYCHVYEPSVATGLTLHDGIKAGHWHLPSVGEYSRMSWHYLKTKNSDATWGIFSQSLAANVLTAFTDGWAWSSSEYSQTQALLVNVVSGQIGYDSDSYKFNSYSVRPVLAFTVEG